jgi:hypothetical protein
LAPRAGSLARLGHLNPETAANRPEVVAEDFEFAQHSRRLVCDPAIMATAMRDAWTDERLDDLNHRVDEGFRRLDADIRALRGEMSQLRGEMNERFDRVDRRFESLQRTLILSFGGIVAALIGLIASIVATGA